MEESRLFILTGPESSGKSTLASQLCDCLQAPLVPEISREYLSQKLAENSEFSYREDDLLAIAKQQNAQEETLLAYQPEIVICDTDLLVIIIWSEVKYGRCEQWVIEAFENSLTTSNPRHYFLCDWNISWQDDPLRETPNDREHLFELYRQKLTDYKLAYTLIKGDQQQRLRQALSYIQG